MEVLRAPHLSIWCLGKALCVGTTHGFSKRLPPQIPLAPVRAFFWGGVRGGGEERGRGRGEGVGRGEGEGRGGGVSKNFLVCPQKVAPKKSRGTRAFPNILGKVRGAICHLPATPQFLLHFKVQIVFSWGHRRRIKTEEKAKVVAVDWGTCFNAALTI